MYHQFLGPPNFWRELLTCTSANTTAHTYTNSPKHCVCLSQTLVDVRWRLHRVRCVRLLACIPLADCAQQRYAALSALARCMHFSHLSNRAQNFFTSQFRFGTKTHGLALLVNGKGQVNYDRY